MIISVDEFKKFVQTDLPYEVLEAKLSALELLIRKYTNNNFQNRKIRFSANVTTVIPLSDPFPYLAVGDTIQISESDYNEGLYTIKSIGENEIVLDKPLYPEISILITKVVYPENIKMGIVNMLNWDINNRDKVGISSESISRHSVTYFNMDGDNSITGYPKSLMGFLTPYMKARF